MKPSPLVLSQMGQDTIIKFCSLGHPLQAQGGADFGPLPVVYFSPERGAACFCCPDTTSCQYSLPMAKSKTEAVLKAGEERELGSQT